MLHFCLFLLNAFYILEAYNLAEIAEAFSDP